MRGVEVRGVEVRGPAGLPVEPVAWPVSPAGQTVVSAWSDQSIASTDQEQLVFQSVVDELAAGAGGPGAGVTGAGDLVVFLALKVS